MSGNVRITDEPYQGVKGGEILPADTTTFAHVLLPASPRHLAWARTYWPELAEDDVDWTPAGKMKVTHRETGAILRIETGMPAGGGEQWSAIRFFCIRGDRLVLLAEPGGQRPSSVIHHGAIIARELSPLENPGRSIY